MRSERRGCGGVGKGKREMETAEEKRNCSLQAATVGIGIQAYSSTPTFSFFVLEIYFCFTSNIEFAFFRIREFTF
jgi:hypothetical protein